jgi:hypothetical protein
VRGVQVVSNRPLEVLSQPENHFGLLDLGAFQLGTSGLIVNMLEARSDDFSEYCVSTRTAADLLIVSRNRTLEWQVDRSRRTVRCSGATIRLGKGPPMGGTWLAFKRVQGFTLEATATQVELGHLVGSITAADQRRDFAAPGPTVTIDALPTEMASVMVQYPTATFGPAGVVVKSPQSRRALVGGIDVRPTLWDRWQVLVGVILGPAVIGLVVLGIQFVVQRRETKH